MKIKNGFVLEQIGDSYVAVALGEAASTFRGFVKMNKTGAFLWNLLTESDMSIDELTGALTSSYEVEREIAKSDVEKLVTKLSEAGILEK